MNKAQSSRLMLLDRAEELVAEDPGFARFFKAAIQGADADDLKRGDPGKLELTLRRPTGGRAAN
jgi:glutamate dehydrogenase